MRRKRSTKLNYGLQEERRMLATVSVGSQTDLGDFVPGELVTISESGNEQIFQLQSGDTWSVPTTTSGISGGGTDTLIIDSDLFETFVSLRGFETADVTFATDIATAIDIRARDVRQAPGTSVKPYSIAASSVRLTEASNEFDIQFLAASFAEIRSENPIEIIEFQVDDGVVASDETIRFGLTGFEPGLIAEGQVTIESGDSIDIQSNRIGVTGRLNLVAANDIRIDSRNAFAGDSFFGPFNGNSELARLNFQAGGNVEISMSETGGEFSDPEVSNLALVGENFAENFSLNVNTAILINAPGTTLNVAGTADLTVHRIFLASNATDEIHIGRRAFIRAVPITSSFTGETILRAESAIWFAEPGDVRFGWLRVEEATFVTVHEDDSTFLSRVGGNPDEFFDTELITIRSRGDIQIARLAQIEATFDLNLEADGELVSQPGNKTIEAARINLVGETIRLDSLDATSINFNSPGDVNLTAVQDFSLRGANTGQAIRINAGNRITSTTNATLDARWLEMNSRSIWLANQGASDRITVAGRANFFATDFVVVGRTGTVETRTVNLQTRFADLIFDGNLQFTGDNVASTASFRATGNILDARDTRLNVLRNVDFDATAVFLNDGEDDETIICGHANFNVTVFASVHVNGSSTIGSYRVVGANSWINPDSREC